MTGNEVALITRDLATGQSTNVWIADLDGRTTLVHSTDEVLLEAPNWAPDGRSLLLNGAGRLWRLDVDAGALHPVAIDDLPPINNDHVLEPGRRAIYLSANDGQLYHASIDGGPASRVTDDESHFHFLHGVSPDGAILAYVELPIDLSSPIGRLALMSSSGGPPRYLDTGDTHLDGPEFSPDGQCLYVNTEAFRVRPGHAQLARLAVTGGPLQRLVESDTVDWFPHLSPDGAHATYLSFLPGTQGHPPDQPVQVHLVETSDWTKTLVSFPLLGGQGTLNVNSWAADSRRFAFVSYPLT